MVEAARIREIRKRELGLTQAQFAQLLGVHWVTVSKWERAELAPSAYQAGLIESFGRAARRQPGIGRSIGVALVTAGVIAAVFALLKAAMED